MHEDVRIAAVRKSMVGNVLPQEERDAARANSCTLKFGFTQVQSRPGRLVVVTVRSAMRHSYPLVR
jgi:hypothetical protein